PYQQTGKGERIEEGEGSLTFEKGRFIWPVKGEVVSPFGIRGRIKHDGIDIAAMAGTPVLAGDDGEVMYSANTVRGYGNMIIIKHHGNFFTIYAHNEENLVKVGDMVKKGDVIAKVGNTGNTSGYHLHFEIRNSGRPRNPLFFLP
ncbi:MAG: M23 family metallopeptidase, partial [Deltaproteobacteria bacterium]|nr:M23 family metallopeptidase [Deltaproteobacteria bacterium]